jgi:2,4-dienoyl-CoA reductase-like NADH-dependent reductase (Old Yellow Enzyme family)
VTYDARGVPTDAYIDYKRDWADEEFGWVVTSFTPAP